MNYRINSGDTLSALAQRFGTSVSQLAQANNIANPDLIISGASLRIPGGSDSFSSGGAPGAGPGGASPTGSAPAGNVPGSIDGSEFGPNAARLAEVARRTASNMNTRGWCAKGVNDALEAAGLGVQRVPSAYMAADVMARSGKFREVSLTPDEIRNLPPGAVIVSPSRYNGTGSPHGHISVTLGNGMEASDHVRSLIVAQGQRVFIPV